LRVRKQLPFRLPARPATARRTFAQASAATIDTNLEYSRTASQPILVGAMAKLKSVEETTKGREGASLGSALTYTLAAVAVLIAIAYMGPVSPPGLMCLLVVPVVVVRALIATF
jgi:hypothetical protein